MVVNAPFHVTQEAFSGPLDVLLALIEKRKLLINDIALAEVTDDFLQYISAHPDFPTAETANFILVGSTLLLIKSKSLLPVLAFTEEEVESMDDLERRLKELEVYKRVGLSLRARYGSTMLYSRSTIRRTRVVEFSPDRTMTLESLHEAMFRVIRQLPAPKEPVEEAVVERVMSLEDMVSRLTDRLNDSLRTSFREFAGSTGEGRIHIVVSFLAMLELVKQGIIRVEQQSHFEDIIMEQDTVGLPRY